MAQFIRHVLFKNQHKPVTYVGSRRITPRTGIDYMTVQSKDFDTERPCSVDITEWARLKGEQKLRWNGKSYDNKDNIVRTKMGVVINNVEVGSDWEWSDQTVLFDDQASWGGLSKKMAPAYQGISLAVPEQGSFVSWNAIQSIFGTNNQRLEMDMAAKLRSMDQAEINPVRFVWRLAYLYVRSLFKVDGRNPMVTRAMAIDQSQIGDFDVFRRVLDRAVGSNIIPFIRRGSEMDAVEDSGVIALACTDNLYIEGEEQTNWPSCGEIYFTHQGIGAGAIQTVSLDTFVIERAARSWCATYASVELFEECVDAIAMIHISNNNMNMFSGTSVVMSLPRLETGALAMAPLMMPVEITFNEMLGISGYMVIEKAVLMRAICQLCVDYYCYAAVFWQSSYGVMTENLRQVFWSVLDGAYRPQIWRFVQGMFEQLGIKGEIGRIIGSLRPGNKYKNGWKLMHRTIGTRVQWDEIIRCCDKVPKEASIWPHLYPLVMDKETPFNVWSEANAYHKNVDVSECLGSVSLGNCEYGVKTMSGIGSINCKPYKPQVHKNGRLVDHAFMSLQDCNGDLHSYIFRVTDRDFYYMMRDETGMLFTTDCWLEKNTVEVSNGTQVTPDYNPFNGEQVKTETKKEKPRTWGSGFARTEGKEHEDQEVVKKDDSEILPESSLEEEEEAEQVKKQTKTLLDLASEKDDLEEEEKPVAGEPDVPVKKDGPVSKYYGKAPFDMQQRLDKSRGEEVSKVGSKRLEYALRDIEDSSMAHIKEDLVAIFESKPVDMIKAKELLYDKEYEWFFDERPETRMKLALAWEMVYGRLAMHATEGSVCMFFGTAAADMHYMAKAFSVTPAMTLDEYKEGTGEMDTVENMEKYKRELLSNMQYAQKEETRSRLASMIEKLEGSIRLRKTYDIEAFKDVEVEESVIIGALMNGINMHDVLRCKQIGDIEVMNKWRLIANDKYRQMIPEIEKRSEYFSEDDLEEWMAEAIKQSLMDAEEKIDMTSQKKVESEELKEEAKPSGEQEGVGDAQVPTKQETVQVEEETQPTMQSSEPQRSTSGQIDVGRDGQSLHQAIFKDPLQEDQ